MTSLKLTRHKSILKNMENITFFYLKCETEFKELFEHWF